MKRNRYLENLSSSYLFVEIGQRKHKFLSSHPTAKVINLGVGDTTEPLPLCVAKAMEKAAAELATRDGYSGYGPFNGNSNLRRKIAKTVYADAVSMDEIYISDGSKSDIARFQNLFGPDSVIALQDPTYPAFVGSSVISGKTGEYLVDCDQYKKLIYLPCRPDHHFFPDLNAALQADVIIFCSPNNPTGVVATHLQLAELVEFAKEHRKIILFDAAYASYIQDTSLPKSIYEIPGAQDVAIELGSFSKSVGFTGVRLGWSVVPKSLRFDDGTYVKDDWEKVISNCFNGASNIVQKGGIAALEDDGIEATKHLVEHYLENAKILRQAVLAAGYPCYGGTHSPFLWVDLKGVSSWEAFDRFLEEAHLIVTPGVGFGPSGEGYIRLSGFGHREDIEEASQRFGWVKF